MKCSVWMFDGKVVYLEGPYLDDLSTRKDDITSGAKILKSSITRQLLKIADMVDER